MQAYGEDVTAETGLTLSQYINEVFTALKAPYETISPGDTHYDSAVNLLESLVAIKKVNLLVVVRRHYLMCFN